uniref:Uncharacterized protein n=1 Tax=Picea glauca TaxID=3330 RepID=A0A124GP20_PICGL|nr:hypothetical protein ABT39_MTgene442 [Picea glauca]
MGSSGMEGLGMDREMDRVDLPSQYLVNNEVIVISPLPNIVTIKRHIYIFISNTYWPYLIPPPLDPFYA